MEERLGKGDVMLAQIILNQQTESERSERIEVQVSKTNGRVTKLEKLRTIFFGVMVGVALATTSGPGILRAIISLVK